MAKFFAYWNREVLQSAAFVCRDFQHYAEILSQESNEHFQTEFFNILKHATYTHFGFTESQDKEFSDTLSRYSFSYLSCLLYDYLNSHFCKKDITVFEDPIDSIRNRLYTPELQVKECCNNFQQILQKNKITLSDETQTELKKVVKTFASNEAQTVVHNVLAELNFRALFDRVRPDLKDLPGLIHCGEFKNKAVVYLNITPPCDIAQGRRNANLYLEGNIRIYRSYPKALRYHRSKDGERYYKTPPALEGDTFIIFRFDLKNIKRELNEDIDNAILMLKESVFADLMQKFGQHNSRLGARTF